MINVPGLVGLVVFYLLILGLGIGVAVWKSWKRKSSEEDMIVADRDIGLVVGIFTMTATWVGGGFLNGTAEVVYLQGILYAQTPIGYAISLVLGGLFFAGPYRRREYLTMIDPFQEKYGRWVGGLMYFPALLGELFWCAAILNALGASVSVILGLDFTISVVVSAAFAVVYTFAGGLFSVAYTDVLQLLCIPIGLVLAAPFAWHSEHVEMERMAEVVNGTTKWVGRIPGDGIGAYVDLYVLLIFGGIPWQAYFQRVLSTKTVLRAQVLSVVAGFGCFLLAIPPAVIGLIAQNVDWDAVNGTGILAANPSMVLPLTIAKCTPPAVTFLALGAISAAVMSSSDSSLLSASSMFAHNIYKGLFHPSASDVELTWILRCSVIVCGIVATVIGLKVQSVHVLFWLCGDFVFVILFPQLLSVIYLPFVNSYGALTGFLTGVFFRLLVGVPDIGFPGAFEYGDVPYKTIVMLLNLAVTVNVSLVANYVFLYRDTEQDVLGAFEWERGLCLDHRRIRAPVRPAPKGDLVVMHNLAFEQ